MQARILKTFTVHEIYVQVHRDTEIVTGSDLVNCAQKSEELLKLFPGATAIKLDCQDHKSLKMSSNPNMLSMEKRYFISFKTLIQVVSLGITLTNETYNMEVIQRRF